ncbi:hypothetical protein HPB47_017062 [Ixodes persulcatus]|uniref:Uncharacterized protein n=1 Tax=Ixodes persulcatus TaxID=34615 RepID=A0AC60R340_IXOPE|nr:hypothetical protein HPB47_017062 [Ixodes persulcatus]
MPRLPEADTKVIIRPGGGLNLGRTSTAAVADAILAVAGTRDDSGLDLTICPNTKQNILVASTTSDRNIKALLNVKAIKIQGIEHSVNVYEAAPIAEQPRASLEAFHWRKTLERYTQ